MKNPQTRFILQIIVHFWGIFLGIREKLFFLQWIASFENTFKILLLVHKNFQILPKYPQILPKFPQILAKCPQIYQNFLKFYQHFLKFYHNFLKFYQNFLKFT